MVHTPHHAQLSADVLACATRIRNAMTAARRALAEADRPAAEAAIREAETTANAELAAIYALAVLAANPDRPQA